MREKLAVFGVVAVMASGCTATDGNSDSGSDAGCSLEEICAVNAPGHYGCGGGEGSEAFLRCCPEIVHQTVSFACNSSGSCCGEFNHGCFPAGWSPMERPPDGGIVPDGKICDLGL